MPKDAIAYQAAHTELSRLIAETGALTCSVSNSVHRPAVECLLRYALPHIDGLDFSDTPVNDRGYARKVLYTHPEGHFSVLALKWMPGAETPIHGHNAWGCVGVIEGEIGCETYCCRDGGQCEGDLTSTGRILAGVGAVASVEPNPKGIHRLFNPTGKAAVTLHIYGMDLSENPTAVNVPYQH
ncbi:MAG: hypothetical protein EP335_06425 [Alphaproteobacteria bacterium]|nr:MAG: hypothetical protein EP335_06425 [Alphaproteobacteria bacterium]